MPRLECKVCTPDMSGVQIQNLAYTWRTFVNLVTEIHQFEPNRLLKSTWNLLLHIYDSGIGVHLHVLEMMSGVQKMNFPVWLIAKK